MQKSKQRLIILYGSHNTGKTFLFNLFKKEGNYICLDFFKPHFILYRKPMEEQIGKELTERLANHIEGETIFSIDIFFKEVGFVMNQFPDHNFVIKSGDYEWMIHYKDIVDDMFYEIKHFMPVKRKHIHFIHASRHPKICLATAYDQNTDIKEFVERWTTLEGYFRVCPDIYHIVKVEILDQYPLMKKLLKKVDFNNLLSYTDFDFNEYRTNIFERYEKFKGDLKIIDIELKGIMEYLGYDYEDENLIPYLKKLFKMTDLKIKRGCPTYEID